MVDKEPRILVAFRTHYWNENVEFLARKLYGAVAKLDFVVMADETRALIETNGFPKVSHTANMEYLQLPHWPKSYNNLHYNGDYVFYDLRHQRPDYDFYVLIENDAIVNFDLEKSLLAACAEGVDLIAMVDEIDSPLHVEFHKNVKKWFAHTGRAFFPFVGMSGRLIDGLYVKRLEIARAENAEEDWPYCESFVASYALSDEKCKIVNLDGLIDTVDYTFMRHKYLHDPKVHRYMSICHPVVGKEFMEKNLQVADIESIFDEKSDLYTGVKALFAHNDRSFYPFLESEIKKKKNLDLLTRFHDFAFSEGWISYVPAINQAFAKPALQSSVGPFSKFDDVERDAAQLVDGLIVDESKSHTAYELKPWVQIDLQGVMEIREILIYVRPVNFHIFNDFYISLSDDGVNWEIAYKKTSGVVPDAAGLKPVIVRFKRGSFARFVRVTLDATEALFLNQIEIYSY